MSKGIVLYKSKYGSTKKYAEWFSQTVGYDIRDVEKASVKQVVEYDRVILFGAIYASGIGGLPFIKKNYKQLCDKKLAVFCVGASPYDEQAFDEIKARNLKDELNDIPLFYGRGAWNEEKMKFIDRTMCKMLQKYVAKKDPSEYAPWERALMSAAGQTCDWTDKTYLTPLIELVNNWE